MKKSNISEKLNSKLKKEFKWQMQLTGDFYYDLAMKESSHNKKSINGSFSGLYQMGIAALIDTGYIDRNTKKWIGKHNIHSREDFLNDATVQNIAIREYHNIVWRYIKSYHKYEGQEIAGIKLSKSGMICASHLVGHRDFKKFINSNGKIDEKDNNHIKGSQYLEAFSEHQDVDFSLEGYFTSLSEEDAKKYKQPYNKPDKKISGIEAILEIQDIANNVEESMEKLLNEFIATNKANFTKYQDSSHKEYNELKKAKQEEIDRTKILLENEANAYIDSVILSRLDKAKEDYRKTHTKSGTVYVDASDIAEQKKKEMDKILEEMRVKGNQELFNKQEEIKAKWQRILDIGHANLRENQDNCKKSINNFIKTAKNEAQKENPDINSLMLESQDLVQNFAYGLNHDVEMLGEQYDA